MKDLFKNPYTYKVIWSVVTVVLSIVLYKIITGFLEKHMQSQKLKVLSNKKIQTYIKLIKSIIRYIFILLTFLLVLQIFGVNISSVIAGVGVLGIVFGFAIQDWLKDMIRGTTILSDNYFAVGDIVKYGNIEGKVIVIGLNSTKIQDIRTNNIISIANRKIEEIQVVSNMVYVNIPMPYEVSLDKAEEAIDDIVEITKKCEHVDDCIYKGVNDLADSSIQYLLAIQCNPNYKLQVRRDTLRSILQGLAKHNIEVPYNQLDIHQKD